MNRGREGGKKYYVEKLEDVSLLIGGRSENGHDEGARR